MVEFFCSWSKGLAYDEKALGILKNSGIISGVEMYNCDEQFDLVKKFGLKVSLHNPLKYYEFLLEEKELAQKLGKNKLFVDFCNRSDTKTIGFHAGTPAIFNGNLQGKELLSGAVSGFKYISGLIRKDLIVEPVHYEKSISFGGTNEGLAYASGPEFLESFLQQTKSGVLFDVSHVLISSEAKLADGFSSQSTQKHFDSILRVSEGKIRQMHLNVPNILNNEFMDMHLAFKADLLSKRVLGLAKSVVNSAPKLELITLEIDTGLSPVEHANKIVEQARLVARTLALD